MKKVTRLIISLILVFSSIFSVNAQGVLWDILELSFGSEKFQIESIPSLPTQRFTSPSVQSTYDNFIIIDAALRDEFISQYSSGKIDYYQMQDLIQAYKNFLYYVEKTFTYVAEHEKDSRSTDIQNAIVSSYSNMRTSYQKVQNIIE